MLPLALSTSWNAGRHREGEPLLTEIRELGFERVELSHNIPYSLCPGLLSAIQGRVMTVSSVHNFCPVPLEVLRPSPNCFEFSDPRDSTRRIAVQYTLETLDFAVRVGAKAVVLHLGSAGPRGITAQLERMYRQGHYLNRRYVRAKIEAVALRRRLFEEVYARVRPCLEQIVAAAQERGLRLGFECREDYAEFPDEIEMERLLADFPSEMVGYWHDFGHAARKEFLGWHDHSTTLAARRDRLIGCHLHDATAPDRDHRALGTGSIDFATLIPLLPEVAIPVLELSPRISRDDVIKSKVLWEIFARNSVSLSAS